MVTVKTESVRRRGRWRPLASPLTRRILAVNLIAPVLLVAGLMFLDRYKQALIESELAGLATQAEMVAGAVGESAVAEQSLGFLEINAELAQVMVRRLAQPAQMRARLFDAVGDLAADSQFVLSAKGNIQIEDLDPPPPPGFWSDLAARWDRLSHWMPADPDLPLHVERLDSRGDQFPEVVAALAGETGTAIRSSPEGGIVLSVAVPVSRYKQVVGALMVTHDGRAVAHGLFQVRLAIAQVFIVTLAVTVGLSFFLAGTIARPVRRLAMAAHQVRRGRGQRARIPDLSARGDEIGELSLALKEMTAALWTRMDAIERFAADVSHEIKNPLTSVRSAVETAARISDPEKQKRLLEIIRDDVERLNRLITDISDASRVDAEMSRAEMEPVPLATLLATLAQVYQDTGADGSPAVLVTLPDTDPLTVAGIDGRLVQVLRNLIGNALSFSPPGGTIRLSGWRDDGVIHVAVEDDGPGIPEGKLEAIFDRFYTERPAGEKFGTHSGLGLSISKQIVDAHQGRIHAENRTDADGRVIGARFVVTLPAH
ncbi:histidine kinase [Magnetospirillum moscoviense]|uniref:histidine kinase n=1 Tax=Magnetospirillum moscoviense TaxID=1437059 RepID=A0A178MN95_9PROT|nr:histidine kinase [Magnetospirillum moscoviense]